MNRKIILSVIFILSFISFTLRNSNAQLLKFGIKGGMNLSDISGLKPYETQMKTGLNVYIFADAAFFKILSISGEAGYSQKGFATLYSIYDQNGYTIGTGKTNAKLSYVDISILGKLRFPGGSVIPYILAGPSLGIKLNDEVSPFDANNLRSFIHVFKSTSFGMKFGIGSELNIISKINFIAEARYNIDFSVSYEMPELVLGVISWPTSSNDIKNKVFEFMIGVKF